MVCTSLSETSCFSSDQSNLAPFISPSHPYFMENPLHDIQAERVNRFFDRLSTLDCLKFLVKIMLIFRIFQIILNITVLFINRNSTCKASLRLFLIVYTVLVLVQGVLSFIRNRGYFYAERIPDLHENTELGLFNNFIDAFTLFWYLTGFHWIHECKSCRVTDPSLYYTSLFWIYFGMFIIISPLLAIVLLIILITYIRPVLPISEYIKKESNIPLNDANCTICLNEYNDGDKIKNLPCQHHFHLNCIDEWFKVDDICPLCKKPIHVLYDLFDEQYV